MTHQHGVDPTAGDNADKAEPRHLKRDTDEPCPAPAGCDCRWTRLTLGWSRGANSRCTIPGH